MTRNRALAFAAAVLAAAAATIALDRWFPPDVSRWRDHSTLVLADDGTPLHLSLASDGQFRLPVAPDAVDPTYLRLLFAAEDKRFYRHWGVDPLAVGRAAWQWLGSGHVVSGGSTLTMQVARLLEPSPRTVVAKIRQIVRAVQLERRYDKSEILSMYLTLAPFGGNVQGVRAASLAYFNHPPAALTAAEAALLVSLPQAPERLRPDRHPLAAEGALRRLASRLVAAGALSPDLAGTMVSEPVPRERHAFARAPHLAQYLAAHRSGEWKTTLDPDLQTRLERLVRSESQWLGDRQAAVLVVEAPERKIRAWVGGPGLDTSAGYVDMVLSHRSPGSALKPLIYAMGFDERIVHPGTVIDDQPTRFDGYLPRNFDRGYQGQVTVRRALQQSLNLPAVAVLNRLGPDHFVETLRNAGVDLRLPGPPGPAGLAVALGGVGITLHDLVMAYAALATDGQVRPLRVSTELGAEGGGRLVSRDAAAAVTDILADAPRPEFVAAGLVDGRQIAFKTGTSFGYRDAWAIGWNRRYVVGVWVGRPDGTPRPGMTGRTTAAPILFRAVDLLTRPETVDSARTPDRMTDRAVPAALSELRPPDPAGGRGLGIVYPVPNGVIGAGTPGQGGLLPIPLRASGGKPPYQWYVDGAPLPTPAAGHTVSWRPAGEGFFRITVVDAAGGMASLRTRVVTDPGQAELIAGDARR